MKKMTLLLIFLIIIYFSIRVVFHLFGNGYEINYKLEDEQFSITEKYIKNEKNEFDNYLITIDSNNNLYSYQLTEKFNKKHIVKDIKYYKGDNMECILPIFEGDKVIFDVTCSYNNQLIYYHNMNDKADELTEFIDSLKGVYFRDYFVDNVGKETTKDLYTISTDNIIDQHYVALTSYNGVLLIGKENDISVIDIFETDKYIKEISTFIGDYYVVADYNQEYEFNKFYILNIKNKSLKTIKSFYDISFDSYIQGVVGESVYIFDPENKVQYEINVDKMIVKKIGDISSKIKYYEYGNWIEIGINEAINTKLFKVNNYRKVLDDGTIIDTVGNKLSGYIYTYEKNEKGYSLYKSNILTPNIKNYLFEIEDIDSIIYMEGYIYFKDGNYIKYYHEKMGTKKIIISDELLFNKNILYNVI